MNLIIFKRISFFAGALVFLFSCVGKREGGLAYLEMASPYAFAGNPVQYFDAFNIAFEEALRDRKTPERDKKRAALIMRHFGTALSDWSEYDRAVRVLEKTGKYSDYLSTLQLAYDYSILGDYDRASYYSYQLDDELERYVEALRNEDKQTIEKILLGQIGSEYWDYSDCQGSMGKEKIRRTLFYLQTAAGASVDQRIIKKVSEYIEKNLWRQAIANLLTPPIDPDIPLLLPNNPRDWLNYLVSLYGIRFRNAKTPSEREEWLERMSIIEDEYTDFEVVAKRIAYLRSGNKESVEASEQNSHLPKNDFTTIRYAIINENFQWLRKYFDANSNAINRLDNFGKAPLHIAIENERLNSVKFLLDMGADPLQSDSRGKSPIFYSALNNQVEYFKMIFEAIGKKSPDRLLDPEVFIMACDMNAIQEVSYLLDAGVSVNSFFSTFNTTPLMCAVTNEAQCEILQLLLDRGADVDFKSHRGFTALHIAAIFTNTEAIKLLIERGAEISSKDKFGNTAEDLLNEQVKSLTKNRQNLISSCLSRLPDQVFQPLLETNARQLEQNKQCISILKKARMRKHPSH